MTGTIEGFRGRPPRGDGIKLSVQRVGVGQTVVLLHGFPPNGFA